MEFETIDLLQIASGRLLRSMDDIYRTIDRLLGGSVYTHEIPVGLRICGPHILAKHPKLAEFDFESLDAALKESSDGDRFAACSYWFGVETCRLGLPMTLTMEPITNP